MFCGTLYLVVGKCEKTLETGQKRSLNGCLEEWFENITLCRYTFGFGDEDKF